MCAGMSLDLGKISDLQLRAVGEKVGSGTRLSHADAELLFTSPDLLGVGMLSDYVNRRNRDVYVGDNCFIGAHSIILPGVTIGDSCIVAADGSASDRGAREPQVRQSVGGGMSAARWRSAARRCSSSSLDRCCCSASRSRRVITCCSN